MDESINRENLLISKIRSAIRHSPFGVYSLVVAGLIFTAQVLLDVYLILYPPHYVSWDTFNINVNIFANTDYTLFILNITSIISGIIGYYKDSEKNPSTLVFFINLGVILFVVVSFIVIAIWLTCLGRPGYC